MSLFENRSTICGTDSIIIYPSLNNNPKKITKIGFKGSILLESKAYKVLQNKDLKLSKLEKELNNRLLNSGHLKESYMDLIYADSAIKFSIFNDDRFNLYYIDIDLYNGILLFDYLNSSNYYDIDKLIRHEFTIKNNGFSYVKRISKTVFKRLLKQSVDFYKEVKKMNEIGYYHNDLHSKNIIVTKTGFKMIDFQYLYGNNFETTVNKSIFKGFPSDIEYSIMYINFFIYCGIFHKDIMDKCIELGIIKISTEEHSIKINNISVISSFDESDDIKFFEMINILISSLC